MYHNDIKTTLCRCGKGKVMTGRHQEFNARSKDGKIICAECKTNEIIEGWKADKK